MSFSVSRQESLPLLAERICGPARLLRRGGGRKLLLRTRHGAGRAVLKFIQRLRQVVVSVGSAPSVAQCLVETWEVEGDPQLVAGT